MFGTSRQRLQRREPLRDLEPHSLGRLALHVLSCDRASGVLGQQGGHPDRLHRARARTEGLRHPTGVEQVAQPPLEVRRRHCCIKAKGVLATHQNGEAGPSGTLKNRNKPGIRDLLRGFWASRWTRSGEPIA
jgi:hypothetical protein